MSWHHLHNLCVCVRSSVCAPAAWSWVASRGVQEGGPGGVGGERGHHDALKTAILRGNPVGLVASHLTLIDSIYF